ncbi:MAG: hypothetical protein V4487_02295 [Chlamydiota bacterium]
MSTKNVTGHEYTQLYPVVPPLSKNAKLVRPDGKESEVEMLEVKEESGAKAALLKSEGSSVGLHCAAYKVKATALGILNFFLFCSFATGIILPIMLRQSDMISEGKAHAIAWPTCFGSLICAYLSVSKLEEIESYNNPQKVIYDQMTLPSKPFFELIKTHKLDQLIDKKIVSRDELIRKFKQELNGKSLDAIQSHYKILVDNKIFNSEEQKAFDALIQAETQEQLNLDRKRHLLGEKYPKRAEVIQSAICGKYSPTAEESTAQEAYDKEIGEATLEMNEKIDAIKQRFENFKNNLSAQYVV